jgi:DNA-binding transcriptional ArsR family regulator
MNDSRTEYSAPAPVSSPPVQLPQLPESTGDRATLRTLFAWLGHVELPSGRKPTPADRLVWTMLFAHCDVQTQAGFPRLTTVAELTGLSLRAVRNSVRKLEALGLVRSQPRPGRSTIYRLTLPASSAPARRAAPPPTLTPSPTIRRHPKTPARGAATPARGAVPPRHGMPPEELSEKKEIKNSSRAPALGTPARDAVPPASSTPAGSTPAAALPGRAATSAPACAAATAPAGPETTPGRTETPASPQARPARHARERAAALGNALANAWTPPHPGTATPRHDEPHELEHDAPEPRHDAPPPPLIAATPVQPASPLPDSLARIMGRVAALNGGRR